MNEKITQQNTEFASVLAPLVLNGNAPSKPQSGHEPQSGHDALRLEAQARSHELPDPASARENDVIARNRDEEGQPLPNRTVFIAPALFSGRTVNETALKRVIAVIEQKFPGRGASLEADFDEGVQNARTEHVDVHTEAWNRLALENAETQRRNLALEARRAELERLRDAATDADRQKLVALGEELRQLNQEAAEAVARAGHQFDAARPATESLLAHVPKSLHALAGARQLPFDEEDRDWGDRLAHWTDVLSGIILGTSIALLSGVVQASQLSSAGDGMAKVVWFVFAGVGVGLSFKASETLCNRAVDISERFWLGRPASEWRQALLWGVFQGSLLALVWMGVDAFGLAKLAALQGESTGQSPSVLALLCLGAVVALASVLFALERGHRHGRFRGCRNRLVGEQDVEFEQRDAQIRARAEMQDALAAVARVLEVHSQRHDLETRIAETATPFEEERATLETQKREMRKTLNDEERKLIRDARDNWIGANGAWVALRDHLLDVVEEMPTPESLAQSGDRLRQDRRDVGPGATRRPGLLGRIVNQVKGWFRR